ncbi:hypothetical protein B0H13DRAFT_1968576, partial [Mycena leptocephala]
MAVPHRQRLIYRLLVQQARLQQVGLSPAHARASAHSNTTQTTPPMYSAHGAAAPHRPNPVDHRPARRHRLQRLSTFRSKPVPVGHPKYCVEHRRSAQLVLRGFPIPHGVSIASPRAAPVLCADAERVTPPLPLGDVDSFASVLHIHAVQSLRDRMPPSEQDVGARVAVSVSHWGRAMGLWCVVHGARGCGCGVRTIPILLR